jgi:hypothetical protein
MYNARKVVRTGRGKRRGERAADIGFGARHEKTTMRSGETAADLQYLRYGFAGGEDHLGQARSECALVIDARPRRLAVECYGFTRPVRQSVEYGRGGDAACGNLFQQTEQLAWLHAATGRNASR